jgi:hypothetical protein
MPVRKMTLKIHSIKCVVDKVSIFKKTRDKMTYCQKNEKMSKQKERLGSLLRKRVGLYT